MAWRSASSLSHAEHGGFSDSAVLGIEFSALVFVDLLTSDVCFINLKDPIGGGMICSAKWYNSYIIVSTGAGGTKKVKEEE